MCVLLGASVSCVRTLFLVTTPLEKRNESVMRPAGTAKLSAVKVKKQNAEVAQICVPLFASQSLTL